MSKLSLPPCECRALDCNECSAEPCPPIVPAPPPLPDGWVRCSEKMPEPDVWVQFVPRNNGAIYVGVRDVFNGEPSWRDYTDQDGFGEFQIYYDSEIVAWRPLTVPAEVRGLT